MELVTRSHIVGDFEGWNEEGARFELDNGQVWEQARYEYRYQYKYRPRTTVWTDGGRYFLEVEGKQQKIQVRRVS